MRKNFIVLSMVLFSLLILGGLIMNSPLILAQDRNSQLIDFSEKKLLFPTSGKITQYYRPDHQGIDIANAKGTPIWAAQAGTVTQVINQCGNRDPQCGATYGNQVLIDHGNGLETFYAHFDLVSVQIGDHVTQGQVIGTMGNTGKTYGRTGVLLHFEVRENGVRVNPLEYFA